MKKIAMSIFVIVGLIAGLSASTLCPDGTYVGGDSCTLCPDGTYVGDGSCDLMPDGTYNLKDLPDACISWS